MYSCIQVVFLILVQLVLNLSQTKACNTGGKKAILTLCSSSYQMLAIYTLACFLLKANATSFNARLLFNCVSNVLHFLKPQLLVGHNPGTK